MSLEAFVIGQPIAHSFSPKLFAELSGHMGVALTYRAQEISPAGLRSFLEENRGRKTFVGCNVTLPHKVAVMNYLDDLSDEARLCGAVNVVTHRDGKLFGSNTDVPGIQACLSFALPGIRSALIYGAGGAARAAAYVLAKGKIPAIRIYNRTAERAKRLCEHFQFIFPQTEFSVASAPVRSDLYVQATSLGLKLSDDVSPLPPRAEGVAFDLVYGKTETLFLANARAAGLTILSGIDLLIAQALATWEIWFGSIDDKTSVQARLNEVLRCR